MITELAQATGQIVQLADDLLRQGQTRRLDAAAARASQDVQDFKNDLLARRLDTLNLRLGGLRHGLLVRLADAEDRELRALFPRLDAASLLGLYARARAADLAADCADLLRAGSGSAAADPVAAPTA